MGLALIQEYGLQFNGSQASNPYVFAMDFDPFIRCSVFPGMPLYYGYSSILTSFQA